MTALDEPKAIKPPISMDANGVYRVGGTRVRLETVVNAFENGCTAEEILYKYPSLTLPVVYNVLSYYLNNKSEVCAYLERRQVIRDDVDREIENRFPSDGIRERLLARRQAEN
jgi:uncharacterized protein (DUF433 family)